MRAPAAIRADRCAERAGQSGAAGHLPRDLVQDIRRVPIGSDFFRRELSPANRHVVACNQKEISAEYGWRILTNMVN
jgi:hypothetical protein